MSKFSVEHVRTDSHDHFMKSDYEWQVIESKTGKVLLSFDEAYEGSSATGAASVTVSEDEREVVVRYHDGTDKRFPLKA
jgi:hypothetical protein